MAVQSLAYNDLANDTDIPLGLNATKGQHITVSMAEALLPKETEIYLEDQLKETFTLLNLDDYRFIADANLSGTGRFFLHLVNSTLSYGGNGLSELQLYTTNGAHMLHIKGNITSDTLVSVYDTQGRLMHSRQLDGQDKNNTLDLSILSNGMYIVKLRSGSMEKIKKIVVY
jgi:hypothetical protein